MTYFQERNKGLMMFHIYKTKKRGIINSRYLRETNILYLRRYWPSEYKVHWDPVVATSETTIATSKAKRKKEKIAK
jgi:hypothetical protein